MSRINRVASPRAFFLRMRVIELFGSGTPISAESRSECAKDSPNVRGKVFLL